MCKISAGEGSLRNMLKTLTALIFSLTSLQFFLQSRNLDQLLFRQANKANFAWENPRKGESHKLRKEANTEIDHLDYAET